jgi:hypothetical protein
MFSKEVAYEGVPDSEIVFYIRRGDKPQINANIPPVIAQLITSCWQQNPDDRPTFDEIALRLYDEVKTKIHFEENPFGSLKSSPSGSDYSTSPAPSNPSTSSSSQLGNTGGGGEIEGRDDLGTSSYEMINKLIEGKNLNELLKLLETSKVKLKTYRENKQRIISQLDLQQVAIDKEQKFQDNILQEILNNKP